MKRCSWLFFLLLLFASTFGYGQPIENSPAEASDVSDDSFHKFEAKTAWGKIEVVVVDFHGKFGVKVESESPISGWNLKQEGPDRSVSKGGMTPTNQFKFQVPQPFQDSYRLTLYLDSNEEQVPILVRLKAGEKEAEKGKVLLDGLEDFQDNPDRPYNGMVKNFYEKALENYSKGNSVQALALLKKAEELDPLQAQVQVLLLKIQGPNEKPSDPLDKIRKLLKQGKRAEALAQLEDYLDNNPDDEAALELQDKINGQKHVRPVVKPKSDKVKKEPIIAQTDGERQAKADQAYNLGLESYREEDYAAAKKFWEETLKIDPTHIQAKRNLNRLENEHPNLK